MKWLLDWWAARCRATDVRVLWPAIKAQAVTPAQARQAFIVHATTDWAWLRLDLGDIMTQIDGLP